MFFVQVRLFFVGFAFTRQYRKHKDDRLLIESEDGKESRKNTDCVVFTVGKEMKKQL